MASHVFRALVPLVVTTCDSSITGKELKETHYCARKRALDFITHVCVDKYPSLGGEYVKNEIKLGDEDAEAKEREAEDGEAEAEGGVAAEERVKDPGDAQIPIDAQATGAQEGEGDKTGETSYPIVIPGGSSTGYSIIP